jgi:hypothetical protein
MGTIQTVGMELEKRELIMFISLVNKELKENTQYLNVSRKSCPSSKKSCLLDVAYCTIDCGSSCLNTFYLKYVSRNDDGMK